MKLQTFSYFVFPASGRGRTLQNLYGISAHFEPLCKATTIPFFKYSFRIIYLVYHL